MTAGTHLAIEPQTVQELGEEAPGLLLESIQPGSFQISEDEGSVVSNLSYFSFVTLTTLGYGDVTPSSLPARSLSLLEAVMGLLYVAILIARLVGIHISQSMSKKQKES